MESRQDTSLKDVVRRPPRFYFVAGSSPPIPESGCGCRRHSRCFHRRSTASPRPGGIRRPSIRTEPLLRLPTCLGWLAFLPGHGQSRISYGHPSIPPQKGGARPSRGAKKKRNAPKSLVLISCWRRLAHISPTTVRQSSRDARDWNRTSLLTVKSSLIVEASAMRAKSFRPPPSGFRPTRRCVFFSHVVSENAEGEFFRIGNS